MPIEVWQTRRIACGCLFRVIFVHGPGHYLVTRYHCGRHASPSRWAQVTVWPDTPLGERLEAAEVVNPATVYEDRAAEWRPFGTSPEGRRSHGDS